MCVSCELRLLLSGLLDMSLLFFIHGQFCNCETKISKIIHLIADSLGSGAIPLHNKALSPSSISRVGHRLLLRFLRQ